MRKAIYLLFALSVFSCQKSTQSDIVQPAGKGTNRHSSLRLTSGCDQSQYATNLLTSPNPRTLCCSSIYDPTQYEDDYLLGYEVPIIWNSNVANSQTVSINITNIDTGTVMEWFEGIPNSGRYRFVANSNSMTYYSPGHYQVMIYPENGPCIYQNAYFYMHND